MDRPIVHILLCHSPDNPGAKTSAGWTERQFAADVNGCLFGRLNGKNINVWMHEQATLERRIQYLKRAAKANKVHQCVVEVHFNSFKSQKVRGYMTLAHAKSPHAMRLASFIHQQVELLRPDVPSLGICGCDGELRFVGTPKQFPQSRLALLEDVPQWAVIPEPAVLSNPDDVNWITEFDHRRDLGYAIANGILEFIDSLTSEVHNG